MDGLLRRVMDIDSRCIKHGVSFRPQLVGRDVVLTYSDGRSVELSDRAMEARDSRAYVLDDAFKAIKHVAEIYSVQVHFIIPMYAKRSSSVLFQHGFHTNLLCETSDGTRLEVNRARMLTYRGKKNG